MSKSTKRIVVVVVIILIVLAAAGVVWKRGQELSAISKPALRAIPVQVTIVSIDGLLVSTFLTLVFVPILYTFFEETKEKFFGYFQSKSTVMPRAKSSSS